MRVPPKVMTEGGNAFMRITQNDRDHESIPGALTDKSRSTVRFGTCTACSAAVRFHGNDTATFSIFMKAINPRLKRKNNRKIFGFTFDVCLL